MYYVLGAGCGEWTDAASAEALRPCQNLDVSTIKGEEGGENTCKKCEGKVSLKVLFPEIKIKSFCCRFLILNASHPKVSHFTENASVASNVATPWALEPYITLLKDPIKNCTAKFATKRTTLARRCLKYTLTLLLLKLLRVAKTLVLDAKALFFRYVLTPIIYFSICSIANYAVFQNHSNTSLIWRHCERNALRF